MSKKKIIVADLSHIGKVVKLAFAKSGLDVKVVNSDSELKTEAASADAVILNSKFPPSAYELVSDIKAESERALPCILLCGKDSLYDEAQGTDAMVDSHIEIPFNNKALLDLVESLLQKAETMTQKMNSDTDLDTSSDVDEDLTGQASEAEETEPVLKETAEVENTASSEEGLEMDDNKDFDFDDLLSDLEKEVDSGEENSGSAGAPAGPLDASDLPEENANDDFDFDSILNDIDIDGQTDAPSSSPEALTESSEDDSQNLVDDLFGDAQTTEAPAALPQESPAEEGQDLIDSLFDNASDISIENTEQQPEALSEKEGQDLIDDLFGDAANSEPEATVEIASEPDDSQNLADDLFADAQAAQTPATEAPAAEVSEPEDSQDLIDDLFGDAQTTETPAAEAPATDTLDVDLNTEGPDDSQDLIDDLFGAEKAGQETDTAPVADTLDVDLNTEGPDDSQDLIDDLFGTEKASQETDTAPAADTLDVDLNTEGPDDSQDLIDDLFGAEKAGQETDTAPAADTLDVDLNTEGPDDSQDLINDLFSSEKEKSSAFPDDGDLINDMLALEKEISADAPNSRVSEKLQNELNDDDLPAATKSLLDETESNSASSEPLISEKEFHALSKIQQDIDAGNFDPETAQPAKEIDDTDAMLEKMRRKKEQLAKMVSGEEAPVATPPSPAASLSTGEEDESFSFDSSTLLSAEDREDGAFLLGTGEIDEVPNLQIPDSLRNQIKHTADKILRQVSREVIKEIAERVIKETLDELLTELEDDGRSSSSDSNEKKTKVS